MSKIILPHNLFKVSFDSTDNYDEQLRVYEQLIKKCRDEGYLASAQGWDIDYQKLKNLHDWGQLGPAVNWFHEHWWNFGYVTRWLPGLFVGFFLLNLLLIRWLVKSVYFDPELGRQFSEDTSRPVILRQLHRWRFRAAYTLFYTAVIYFNIRLSHEATNYKNFGGLVYLYTLYAVGTLHVVFGILGYLLKT